MDNVKTYYDQMYIQIPQRDIIWSAIAEYIQKEIGSDATVLDLGAGYCSFINQIQAKKKLAVDINAEGSKYASRDTTYIATNGVSLEPIESESVDFVFASNFFEHLDRAEVDKAIENVLRVLKANGKLAIIQPNFSYAYREYFHDYTHKTVFTHVSLSDYLESNGFTILRLVPRFVPFSMQSKYGGVSVPIIPFLKQIIKLYLHLPYKPLAKQMYIVCQKQG